MARSMLQDLPWEKFVFATLIFDHFVFAMLLH
jgi:hypothetical protein